MSAPRRPRGLATLFAVLTLLTIASLVLLAASRQLVLAHANAQNQHRYHQALNYAEEGLRQGERALAAGLPLPNDARFRLKQQTVSQPPGLIVLHSTGLYDGHEVTVQRAFRPAAGGDASPEALSIVGDLDLGGSVNLLSDKPVDMTVDGKVTLGGSVTGIATLLSTSDIVVSGPQAIDVLHANGNIELGNGSYKTVKAVGNLTLRGDAAIATLARVNGKAAFLSSPGADPAVARAEVKGDVEIAMGGARFGELYTEGSVRVRQMGGMAKLNAQRDVDIEGWGAPVSGTVGGRTSYNRGNPDMRIAIDPQLKLRLEPVPLVQLKRPRIDAYDYRGEAHYLFRHDAAGRIEVVVRKIHGLNDGVYRLGLSPDGQQANYLCRDTDSQGRCHRGEPAQRICHGYSPQNDCFAGSRPGAWKLGGTTMAPGVLWFDGDLEIGNGSYHNSFIASGNIATSGQHESYAVNYAGRVGVCDNAGFPTLYPEDYCRQGQFKPRPIGNAVLLAGGYVDGRFQGGNITLGAFTKVYGNVWAGNMLFSAGSTTIHGYVSAVLQGGGGQPHRWGGSTTIDLRELPESFHPDNGSGGGDGGQPRALQPLPYSWMDSGAN
ncbi:pilus assembly PilX N-terminal domain-containing protein [Chromobacterium vaccinii]|uniref:pilus assembly PilX N-terminal domain-containing protein n=1 Tax=Chromobacterium vaccinii TaxID=1108595 RepID=UPI003C733904